MNFLITSIILINYFLPVHACTIPVNCGSPLASSVLVMGYNGVALKGDSVSFTCSSGLVLSGPNSSTCMGNGEWEPDPREVACEGKGKFCI